MTDSNESIGYELVGLPITIISSKDPTLVNVHGEIVLETMKTIKIKNELKIYTIPKVPNRFEIIKDGVSIQLDGVNILGRPEDRIMNVN